MGIMSTTLTAAEYDRRRSLYADTLRWLPIVTEAASVQWVSIEEQFKRDRIAYPALNLPNLTLVDLILGQIHTESGGHQFARGAAGELGLLQIMPTTARELGLDVPVKGYAPDQVRTFERGGTGVDVPAIFDPLTHVKASISYMHRVYLMLRSRGWSGTAMSTYQLTLAGYNGGPGYVLAAIRELSGDQLTEEQEVLQAIRERRVILHTTVRQGEKVMPVAKIAPPAMANYPVKVIEHAQMIRSVRVLDKE